MRQYDRMIHDSIIREADRVELVEGLLVTKMGRNRPHVQAGVRGLRLLSGLVPGGLARSQGGSDSHFGFEQARAGTAVVRGRDEDYDERDVTSADVALVA